MPPASQHTQVMKQKAMPSLLMAFAVLSTKRKLLSLVAFIVLCGIILNFLFNTTNNDLYKSYPRTKYRPPSRTTNTNKTNAILKNNPSLFADDDTLNESETDDPNYYMAFFRETIIESILEEVTDTRLLYDINTPQGKAMKWIIEKDERLIHPDDPHLLQRYALAVFFYATSGENWHYGDLHFLTAVHECYWTKKVQRRLLGVVECDEEKFVTGIQLVENNLQGSLPSEIGVFERLESFDVQENRLTGAIPSTIGSFSSLKNLFLNSNNFEGSIPQVMGQLQNLTLLLLDNNNLTGEIPKSTCTLKDNKKLYSLWADCDGKPEPMVKCDCCSMCCDGLGYCMSEVEDMDGFLDVNFEDGVLGGDDDYY